MGINRFISFSAQRVIFASVYSLLPTTLSVGVLWNHLDSLSVFTGFYLILTKIGLSLVEITAVFFLFWDLSSKDKVLSNYCFFGNLGIVLMVLIHVGAVFQYDSAIAKINLNKSETLNLNEKVLELNNKLMTDQGNTLLSNSGTKLDSRTVRESLKTIVEASARNNKELASEMLKKVDSTEEESKIKTILPVSYITSGAMYIVPILISFLLGTVALFISKTSPTETSVANVVPHPEPVPTNTIPNLDNIIDAVTENEYTEVPMSDNHKLTQDEILEELRK